MFHIRDILYTGRMRKVARCFDPAIVPFVREVDEEDATNCTILMRKGVEYLIDNLGEVNDRKGGFFYEKEIYNG